MYVFRHCRSAESIHKQFQAYFTQKLAYKVQRFADFGKQMQSVKCSESFTFSETELIRHNGCIDTRNFSNR